MVESLDSQLKLSEDVPAAIVASISDQPSSQVTSEALSNATNPPMTAKSEAVDLQINSSKQEAVVQSANTVPVPAKSLVDDDDADDDTDDESEVLEESPCGRWLKRREVIKYCDVPGMDKAYLAMDGDLGVEVVWNEATFSEAKKFRAQEDKLRNVFEALTAIEHPSIVKFHKYWTTTDEAGKEKAANVQPAGPVDVVAADGTFKPAGAIQAAAAAVAAAGAPAAVKGSGGEKTRLIFITEHMTSGTLKLFLRRQKKNGRKVSLSSWKRWCIQILSALNYLHEGFSPPIIHGNLSCDTIFIQHNGLIKIGSLAPDIINTNVKTCRDQVSKNLHFFAPEWGMEGVRQSPAVDVFAFGMCALETAVLEFQTKPTNTTPVVESGGSIAVVAAGVAPATTTSTVPTIEAPVVTGPTFVSEEAIQRTIESLEDPCQKDFIKRCLTKDPAHRPTARKLLLHPVLFEVHSLKLLAAHHMIQLASGSTNETIADEKIQNYYGSETVLVSMWKKDPSDVNGRLIAVDYKLSDFPVSEKLEKFMEDVKFGIYPLTAFALAQPQLAPQSHHRSTTPDSTAPISSEKASSSPEPSPSESRRINLLDCLVVVVPSTSSDPENVTYDLQLNLRLEDSMTRQLCASGITENERLRERAEEFFADELMFYGFINTDDGPIVCGVVKESLNHVGRMAVCQVALPAVPEMQSVHVLAPEIELPVAITEGTIPTGVVAS